MCAIFVSVNVVVAVEGIFNFSIYSLQRKLHPAADTNCKIFKLNILNKDSDKKMHGIKCQK